MTATGRNRREAEDSFRSRLQAALTVVSPRSIIYLAAHRRDPRFVSTRTYDRDVRLRTARGAQITLRLGELARIVEESARQYRVERIAYYYAIHRADSGARIVSWHWNAARPHPPHIHAPLDDPLARGARLHIPGGAVVLADVVEWLVEEWEVVPAVEQWRELLAASRDA